MVDTQVLSVWICGLTCSGEPNWRFITTFWKAVSMWSQWKVDEELTVAERELPRRSRCL